MGKIINIASRAQKEERLQNILDGIEELKDALADVLSEYETENIENERTDMITEALDALEDAYDALFDVTLDE